MTSVGSKQGNPSPDQLRQTSDLVQLDEKINLSMAENGGDLRAFPHLAET